MYIREPLTESFTSELLPLGFVDRFNSITLCHLFLEMFKIEISRH